MAEETPGIQAILAAIHAAPVTIKHTPRQQVVRARPFVTISRQGGAGGRTFGQLLVDRLNALDEGEVPWTLWDRGLVEKVAADHHVAQELVESLEEKSRSWVEEFLASLAIEGDETEARIYQLVASSILALAQRGRVVIVGRGGVYITRNMPGGVHIRLVAPLAYRAKHTAEQLKISVDDAMAHVRRIDKSRSAFYRRYWPTEVVDADAFTAVFNTAKVSEERVAESAIPLILPTMRFMATR